MTAGAPPFFSLTGANKKRSDRQRPNSGFSSIADAKSAARKRPSKHNRGSVESWEYDDVSDVSSAEQTTSQEYDEDDKVVRDKKGVTPGTRSRFLKDRPPQVEAERPVDNRAPVDTAPADTPTALYLPAGARSNQGRVYTPPKSAMEQEKVASTHLEGEQEGVDEDIELISDNDAESRGPGVGSVSVYDRDEEDVIGLGGMVTSLDDDEVEEYEEEDERDALNSFRDVPTRNGMLLEAPSGERSGSASLKPPPHLTPSLGVGASSPSPDLRPMDVVGPITEDSEEEVDDKGQAEEELEGEEGGEGGQEEEGSGGNMTGATGPGGHRLDTLDGASGLRQLPMNLGGPSGQDDEDDDDEEDDDDDVQAPAPEGAYDPAEYENLNVPPEIRELFSYIMRYTPQAIELEHRLRPYIPDYIPAVGDIDAFIKILPPDNSETKVGLTVLDEPSARQSDSTVLDLQLRSLAKHTTAKTVSVKNVESAEKNPKVIEKWTQDISDLHRNKPAPTVGYSKKMPDFDSLMQEWPGELEDLLQDIRLPNAALDLDLENYAGLICAILDIPVYKSKIQSLHVLFTLYSEFRNSVHFRRLADDNFMDNDDGQGDRLVIE